MLQILKSVQAIYLCLLIQGTDQQDCQVYSWQMLLNIDRLDSILSLTEINKLWVVVKDDHVIQKRIVILLHI